MNRTLSGRLVVAYESLKTKEKSSLVLARKWSRLLAGAVAYKSFSLQSLLVTLQTGCHHGGRN